MPLTIQNNGTGNSFVVNDVASDTTPFVIDSAGNVGIGNTPSGTYKVEVTGSVAATSSYASSAAFVGTNASTGSAGILRVTSSSGVNYIQSGLNTTGGSAAPLIFGSINNANQWMQISETGAVTIGGNPINGTWSTYTPTYTNFTLGNGTVDVARYSQVGKIVCLALQITMGTTSSVTGLIRISLPVTAASTATNTLQGGCQLNDSGSAIYSGVSALSSTTQVALYTLNSSATYLTRANTSATVPHTWASTDVFSALIFYEAA